MASSAAGRFPVTVVAELEFAMCDLCSETSTPRTRTSELPNTCDKQLSPCCLLTCKRGFGR